MVHVAVAMASRRGHPAGDSPVSLQRPGPPARSRPHATDVSQRGRPAYPDTTLPISGLRGPEDDAMKTDFLRQAMETDWSAAIGPEYGRMVVTLVDRLRALEGWLHHRQM